MVDGKIHHTAHNPTAKFGFKTKESDWGVAHFYTIHYHNTQHTKQDYIECLFFLLVKERTQLH